MSPSNVRETINSFHLGWMLPDRGRRVSAKVYVAAVLVKSDVPGGK